MPPSSLPKFFFISILSSLIIISTCYTQSYSKCLDNQKSLLLELRNELIFNSSISEKLVQWNQTSGDCCSWYGVGCDATGYVISLQLDDEAISGGICDSSTLFRLKHLEKLNLAFNNFNFTHIPRGFQNLSYLTHLNLHSCNFTGPIPVSTFANLTQLIHVDLSDNLFIGTLSSTIFGGLSNLVHLNLGNNSFIGNIPHSLFGLPSLLELNLSNNLFIGQVEGFECANVSNIVSLDLSSNRLEGSIPDSLFQLHSLEFLLLSKNLFNGTLLLEKFQQSFANLTSLDLSGNSLSVDVGNGNSSSSYRFPKLEELRLASCNLNDFPNLLKHSWEITLLNLSNNRIGGEIPSCIWGRKLVYLDISNNLLTDIQKSYHIPASLQFLNLHVNRLQGELHLPIPPTSDLWFLCLSHNNLSGAIPTSLCNAKGLDILHLSSNKLSGNIPSCLLDNTTNLRVLVLGENNLSGHIPDSFHRNCSLNYFDLNNNTLHGEIPKSIERCKSLEFMNVGNNIINDNFPCMLPSSLRVLVLNSNRFHGEVRCHNSWTHLQVLDISSNNLSGSLEPINFSSWRAMVLNSDEQLRHGSSSYYLLQRVGLTLIMKGLDMDIFRIWRDFATIDFSCNNFHGQIPNALGELSLLHLLNLSHNALNGSIPKSFVRLGKLESLDLSENNLTGSIPQELAGLTFLSFLNLSYNNLVGMIPKGHQLQTFSADSYRGNPRLWGFPLNVSPRNTDENDLPTPEVDNEESKREIEWEYVSAALGYVVGLGSIVWLLLFCRGFRDRYFGKIEEVVEDVFDGRNRRRRRARRRAMWRN